MDDKYIITNDGTRIEIPAGEDMTIASGENESGGWLAIRATAKQVSEYYKAAANKDVNIAWGSIFDYNEYNTDLSGTGVTRYDTNYDTDPLDVLSKKALSQIKYIRERYEKDDPLVHGLVDVLTNLTAGKIRLEGGNEELRRQYSTWYRDKIDVQDLIEVIAHEYWISGNVIMSVAMSPATKRAKLPFGDIDKKEEDTLLALAENIFINNDGKDEILLKAIRLRLGQEVQAARTAKEIPINYAVMDPLTLKPTGYPKKPDYLLKPNQEIITAIRNSTEGSSEGDNYKRQYGEEFVRAIRDHKLEGKLDPKLVRTIFHKKPHYKWWGYVPGGAALDYMQLKVRLKDLGLNTVSQAMSFVVLVKLGSDKYPTDLESLRATSNIWNKRARKNATAVLFQPHTTDIEIIAPPEEAMNLLSAKIFDNPNMQIAQSWGINLALIVGISSGAVSYSFASMAIRPTIRRIVTAQMKIEDFLYKEHLNIAKVMGYEEIDVPSPKFSSTGLENYSETAIAFQSAADRGIPMKYYMESLGIHFDDAIEQAKLEDEMGVGDELFRMRGSPTQLSGDTGRPPGTPNNNILKDEPSNEGLGLNEVYETVREEMEENK